MSTQDARAEVLGRIREAVSDGPVPDEVRRTYRRTSTAAAADVLEQLVDRLVDYRAAVHREDLSTVAGRVAGLLGSDVRYVVPSGLDPAWLPGDDGDAARTRLTEPEVGAAGPLGVRDLEPVHAVVSSSTVSCAETGTIFLTGRPDEGRRAITLVPDHRVCIVPVDTVVELFPQALERVAPTAPITMVSGPSATSDIELERVEGVHGPRRLDVILLSR